LNDHAQELGQAWYALAQFKIERAARIARQAANAAQSSAERALAPMNFEVDQSLARQNLRHGLMMQRHQQHMQQDRLVELLQSSRRELRGSVRANASLKKACRKLRREKQDLLNIMTDLRQQSMKQPGNINGAYLENRLGAALNSFSNDRDGARAAAETSESSAWVKSVSMGVVRAVTRMQANFRRAQARVQLAGYLQSKGTLLAMLGTVQGKSGWYEVIIEGAPKVVKYFIMQDGSWELRAGPLTKEAYAEAREMMASAAVAIQRIGRGKTGRKDIESKQKAAAAIQSVGRGKQARRATQNKRNERNAAVTVQRVGRGTQARQELQQKQEAATKLQSKARQGAAKKEVAAVRTEVEDNVRKEAEAKKEAEDKAKKGAGEKAKKESEEKAKNPAEQKEIEAEDKA
jgi:hypothetical protein